MKSFSISSLTPFLLLSRVFFVVSIVHSYQYFLSNYSHPYLLNFKNSLSELNVIFRKKRLYLTIYITKSCILRVFKNLVKTA